MRLDPRSIRWSSPAALGIALLTVLGGCGGGAEEERGAPTATPADEGVAGSLEAGADDAQPGPIEPQPIDPARTGRVTGTVRFSGDAPPLRPLEDVPDQPGCHEGHDEPPISEYFIVRDGAIQNVIVHVDRGLEGWIVPEREAAESVLEQHGCIYRPHVLTMRTGDTLRVRNSDPTNHNVNSGAKRNKAFNLNQGPGAADIEVVMERPEFVPLRCDIHPWMSAHVAVFEHPFHAITDEAGSFTIEGLPAGTYELEAVHPDNKKIGKRGKVDATVTVVAGETARVEIVF